MISAGRLILGDLFRGLSGRVLIVCADLLRIAGILHNAGYTAAPVWVS